MLPGGPLASTIRRRYSGATTGGTGPILATLVPPADDPLAGPSLKSQTLPPDSTANPHRPATACACASVGEFSIRQKSGPSGNCNTFFSVSTLITRDPGGKACCATTADDNRNASDTRTATALTRRRFTATPPRSDSPDHLRSSNIGASEHPDSTRRTLVCSRPRPGPLSSRTRSLPYPLLAGLHATPTPLTRRVHDSLIGPPLPNADAQDA